MTRTLLLPLSIFLAMALGAPVLASGTGDHTHGDAGAMIEQMEEVHAEHDHGHDFEALTDISEEDMHRTMDFLIDIGLALPPMDSARGRDAFMDKGCIVCHQINDIGGRMGPALDARDMPAPMSAFDFAARMWRGAPVMAELQQDLLGEMIELTGQELADIVAFTHDDAEQSKVTDADIPERYLPLLIE